MTKYSGECPQTFRGMSPNFPGKVSRKSHQIFQGVSSNILGNVAKHSEKCCQTFRGMSSNILGNVTKHSGECRQTFRGMSPNIPGNIVELFGECSQTIQWIFKNNLRHVLKHPVKSMKALGWMYIIVVDTGDHELYPFVEGPLLLNSRKRKRASPRFLTKSKNILN